MQQKPSVDSTWLELPQMQVAINLSADIFVFYLLGMFLNFF
jgi:hypothetical protein